MKKLLLLLILSLLSSQGFAASCPDGSEPTKSVSADGTYYVYNCGTTNKVKVAMKPDSGDWLNEPIFPFSLKEKMLMRYDTFNKFSFF